MLRAGKSATHVAAQITEGDNILATLVGVFGAPRSSVVSVQPRQPAVPSGKPMDFPYIPGVMPAFTQHFKARWLRGQFPYTGDTATEHVVELALRDAGPATEGHVLAMADFIPPIALAHLKQPAFGSTLTWMIEFMAGTFDALSLDGWRVDVTMDHARDGYTGQSVMLWAPGGEPLNLRAEAAKQHDGDIGIELPGNTTYTIEYHYNSSDANATDSSGVEICVQKEKPKNIASLSWLGFDQLLLPAQKWVGTCRPGKQQPITIVGVTPHMHKQGTHMKAVINRANGTKETLHDAPFDFNYQIQYIRSAKINPGDTITTECTFAKPMAFGESTTAEMCYLFTLAYPKNALSDGGLWGTLAHGNGACLGQ